jgi:hypothetical protein
MSLATRLAALLDVGEADIAEAVASQQDYIDHLESELMQAKLTARQNQEDSDQALRSRMRAMVAIEECEDQEPEEMMMTMLSALADISSGK